MKLSKSLLNIAFFAAIVGQAQTAPKDSLIQKQTTLTTQINTLKTSLAKSEAELESVNALLAPPAPKWTHKGIAGISATQSSFTNWSAGGQNSVAVSVYLNAELNYNNDKWMWNTALNTVFGKMYSTAYNWYKADDNINLTTKGGYALDKEKKLYVSVLASFQSQYAKGRNLPSDPDYISNWLAPGYVNLALGFDYKPWKWFSLFYSPLSTRFTIVNDSYLSHIDAFGIGIDKKFQANLGSTLNNVININFGKNISLISKLDFFTPYDKDFGNIVVNWDVMAALKTSKYLTTTVNLGLKYDNNVKVVDDAGNPSGPKVQFKEIIGLGIAYNF
jgi:hypothetical protein